MPFDILVLAFFSLIGIAAGAGFLAVYYRIKLGGYQKIGRDLIQKAEKEADSIRQTAELHVKQQQLDRQREFEKLWQLERKKFQKEEDRLKQREDKLESRIQLADKKILEIERKEEFLSQQSKALAADRQRVSENTDKLLLELKNLSGLSPNEAKEILIQKMTNEAKTEAANSLRRIKKEAEEEGELHAKRIITAAINRLAVPCVSEATVHTVSIKNDEIKGRIIGREGRNIRALERMTGVNFIIDETPGAVVLSGFDPVRLEIAKESLVELLKDGRIHPTRIEEVVEKSRQNVHMLIKQYGEDAAFRAGAMNMHPELIMYLGKLKFRFSFGQNVLDHSLEVSHLMGLMAAELGMDVRLAKRIGLLHDIGKALTHEVGGSHAIIGHDLTLKLGESKETANGVGCHHFEMEPVTCEAALCSAADAISASRPGARSGPVEENIKRLGRLEEMASEYPGVDKAYAMQAGREVRVIVDPETVSDDATASLARELTQRIENELSYYGKIKVIVIREKRFVEYAV
jgi:ribonuclease Y